MNKLKKTITIDDPSNWLSSGRATDYLNRIDHIPHRKEGESVLLELLPDSTRRILDLGSGNGRLIKLVKKRFPLVHAVAMDFSPHMITELKREFSSEETVLVVKHDLNDRLPNLGKFDAIVSSFAIHHLTHLRKKEIYSEIFSILYPGGIFCNLDHISSSSIKLKQYFRKAMKRKPVNTEHEKRLSNLNVQIRWLKEIGYVDVDCYWKWLEFALLIGFKMDKNP